MLLSAIIIAGRSGSAFTAQIGTMQVNQEIDALRTLGLDPIEVLVLPRVFALTLTLPLLVFYADAMGMLKRQVADAQAAQFYFEGKSALPEDPLLLTGM